MPAPKGKKFTVSEFQTWLDGIMEFQESGWSPSPEQWKAIYQKIQNLKEPPQTPRKVSVDDSSIEEIVEEVTRVIPDISHVDFELLGNVLQAIFNQMRQGVTVAAAPTQRNQNPTGPSIMSGDHGDPDQNLAPPPPVQGDNLANMSLSELRKRQGQIPSGKPQGGQGQTAILDDVEDEFV